jgi:hypothetical protein
MNCFAATINRSIALTLAALASPVAPALASTADEFLNAPVWYLRYEVTFTSSRQGSYEHVPGEMISFTSTLERVFSAQEVLNLRSGGPGPISMVAMAGVSDGSTPSVAEAQRMSMEMMALMDHTANWLAGGPAMDENATDAEIAAATEPTSPARVDYKRVDTGRNLTDEMGGKFDLTATTTVKGSGMVLAGGFGTTVLEMDTARKAYVLVLPYGFNAMMARATEETVTITTAQGSPPNETRQTNDVPIDRYPPELKLDEPQKGGSEGGVLIRGVLDPSTGKISGEQSFMAHYKERNETAPGTLVVKYTLTMTKPTK